MSGPPPARSPGPAPGRRRSLEPHGIEKNR